jgi:stage V sporulation protein R
MSLSGVQEKIIELAGKQRITSYNSLLGVSVAKMRRRQFGHRAIYSFLRRAINAGYYQFVDMFSLLQTPFVVVSGVEECPPQETIDIALSHDDHNFLAGGLVSHNTDPAYIYCLDSNTFTDNITVIAHALGHIHFFKNNIWFKPTSQNMMNEFANHRSRILRYMQRWGKEPVTEFIDWCLALETLIDPAKAWSRRKPKEEIYWDTREYKFPRYLRVPDGHDHMDSWINTKDYLEYERKRIEEDELKKQLGIFESPDKDIMGFLRDNAPLKPWQQDILAMLYEEAMYFQPQRMTKVLNEGFASYCDFSAMARLGIAGTSIFDYAEHKASVLGGKYSMNPYKLGFELLLYIENRWNKGRFGREWEECKDAHEREHWDKKLGLGREKVFEVCSLYDDVTAIAEFFDQDFCDEHEFYLAKRYPSRKPGIKWEWKIESKDANVIRRVLMQRYMNGGLPVIKLADPNFRNKRIMLWEHDWVGRTLHKKYTHETLLYASKMWGQPVLLTTKDKSGNEIGWMAVPTEDKIIQLTREEVLNLK